MKFSDLLKKSGEGAVSGGPAAAPVPASAPKSAPTPPVDESDEVVAKRIAEKPLDATATYAAAIDAARALYDALAAPDAPPQAVPKEAVYRLVARLAAGDEDLLALADRSTPDNYLYAHAVNVTVFSARLGLALGMAPADLAALALGAFLHDVGMAAFGPLVNKPGALTDAEKARVQQHVAAGLKMLALFPGLDGPRREAVTAVVGQTHERTPGGGYPENRRGDAIHPLARIVGVCDVYESLTHPRPWRPRHLPHAALQRMVEEHEQAFDPGLVKTLIEALSLYPPGSFVRLGDGEVGRVTATTPGLPTRVKVKVLLDPAGNRVAPPRRVNLATQPVLYIADAVDETALPTPDKKLRLELRAQRWWVKGL